MKLVETKLSHQIIAWFVHFYTAIGGPLGVWAIFAGFNHDFRTAWLLLGITIIIDSTDGALARKFRVSKVLPGVDGRRLDDIIDYFNWVIVPSILLVLAGVMPMWLLPIPLLASSYGFAQSSAKTKDHYFLGFPSYWSLVGYYFYLFSTPILFNIIVILILAFLVFVPIRFPYPTQTRPFRKLTLSLCSLWGMMLLAILLVHTRELEWLSWASLFIIPYYVGLTVWLWLRSRVHNFQTI